MRHVAEATAAEVLHVVWCGRLWDEEKRQGDEIER